MTRLPERAYKELGQDVGRVKTEQKGAYSNIVVFTSYTQ